MKRLIPLIIIFLAAAAPGARAWAPETYTTTSALASGRWMKVRVSGDGLYCISNSTLRSWGFDDPSKVRICGYGGRRLPDRLSLSTYVDDLPEVQTIATGGGLVFYGLGAGEWQSSTSGDCYIQNDYSSCGYYYVGLRSGGEAPTIDTVDGTAPAANPATTFNERVHHELEQSTVPGEAGPLLLGEDFRYTASRTFSLSTPGMTSGEARLIATFVAKITGSATLSFAVNGKELERNSSDAITQPNGANATYTRSTHFFPADPRDRTDVRIAFSGGSDVAGAWLNFLTLNYPRSLAVPSSGYLVFRTQSAFAVSGVSDGAILLDVSDPRNIRRVSGSLSDRTLTVSARAGEYAIMNPGASLPAPTAEGYIANQNLHADSDFDMVIVAPRQFRQQAERLAAFHRSSDDALNVKVVTPEQVYNEFSSGTTDAGAFRRYFKMLYDRDAGSDHRLKYAILMGRTSLDIRRLTRNAPSYPVIPSWMPADQRASCSDNEGYCTDDITAMLGDDSGSSLGRDKLSIAIGRIPVTSADEAKSQVDKTLQYAAGAKKSAWKHRFLFIADDENKGDHLNQSEAMIRGFQAADKQQHMVRKVYIDTYPLIGGTVVEARNLLYRYLDEGVVWWNFIGHANESSWTGENILSYTDINNMYLQHWPFIYAATCNFLRIDGNTISGGELLYKERYGGAVGIISAVRPVYISDNGKLSAAMGRAMARRDSRGQLPTPGQIYLNAKNDVRNDDGSAAFDTNRLRFSFVGDPALRLAMPSNVVRLETIGGKPVGEGEEMPVMSALSRVPVTGSVTAPDGSVLESFNGVILVEIFDAEKSVTTLGRGDDGVESVYDDYGGRVFCGSARVVGGRFSINVSMPLEVTQNYRPATMSLYAYSTEDDTEAVGLNRNFYVYGYDESAPEDSSKPEIETFVLNHSSFRPGDTVNPSPMIIASVRDDVGINLSDAGIGHQITAVLDGNRTFNDLNVYFTPSPDGSPSGIINYPMTGISDGAHTLALRVWDTSGNSATREIEFFVRSDLAPKIFDVYTDANPASTVANFYLSHDQPDAMVTVEVTVYNLLGRKVFSDSVTGRSEMTTTTPVTWDLTDLSGNRVPRGIYLYRASITADGKHYETATRRIAVTAR